MIWVICGAGRRVGKTHLASRLCELLPGSVYVKQGHGRPKRRKSANFFRSPEQVKEFIEAHRGEFDHFVIESNGLARRGEGDVIVFIGPPPGRADVRRDAEALRAAADVKISAGASRHQWRRGLAGLVDPKLRGRVCRALVEQAEFLTRCRLTAATKVWLDAAGQRAFGEGLADLLAEIDRTGSLRQACESAGMSYRYAWKLIRSAESHLGRPLVHARPGGVGGGGSRLSLDGRHLLDVFRTLDADVAAYAAECFAELYGKGAVNG